MKLTHTKLRRLIKEELESVLTGLDEQLPHQQMMINIITRFSILPNCMQNESPFQKENVLDPDRLDFKFYVFENVTLPSIVNQSYKNFNWYIVTAKKLPDSYKQKLQAMTDPYPFIHVEEVSGMSEFFKICKEKNSKFKKPYSTVRIDDDDSLHPEFLMSLSQYSDSPDNTVISHPLGTHYWLDEDKSIVDGPEYERPLIALGLAAINNNIYGCGNHTKVHEKYPVIYNRELKNAWKVCNSEHTDSNRTYAKLQWEKDRV